MAMKCDDCGKEVDWVYKFDGPISLCGQCFNKNSFRNPTGLGVNARLSQLRDPLLRAINEATRPKAE